MLKNLNEYEEAITYFEMAMDGQKETEGTDNVEYAMIKAMAGGCHRELGNYNECDEHLKDAYLTVAMKYGEENMTAA